MPRHPPPLPSLSRHPPPLPSLSLPSRHELRLLRLCPRNMTYPALSAIATWACLPRLCPLDIASPLVQSARASAGSVPRQRSLRERLDAAPSRRAPPRRMSNPRGCSAGVRRLLRRCHTRPSRTAAACAAPTGRALPARPTPRPPARPPIRAGRRARRRRSGRGWRCRGAGCHAAGCRGCGCGCARARASARTRARERGAARSRARREARGRRRLQTPGLCGEMRGGAGRCGEMRGGAGR